MGVLTIGSLHDKQTLPQQGEVYIYEHIQYIFSIIHIFMLEILNNHIKELIKY